MRFGQAYWANQKGRNPTLFDAESVRKFWWYYVRTKLLRFCVLGSNGGTALRRDSAFGLFSRLKPVLHKCWQLTKCWIRRLQRVCETAAAEEPSDGEDVGAMFFLMRYHTIAANRREINLARQFCRVNLAHRMETNVARHPFEVIRLPRAFISSLVDFYLGGLFCVCLELGSRVREHPIQGSRHYLLDRSAFSICDDSKLRHGLSIERICWE